MASRFIPTIGAGIGGLSTGCYAQMNGCRTRILEMHSSSLLFRLFFCALAASGCTTTHSNKDDRIGAAVQQPLQDVSLVREEPPEILKRAAAAPYVLEIPFNCTAASAEIAALNVVLGPDVDESDADKKTGADAGGLAAGAVTSVIGLPFRGVIRMLSGAEYRDRVLADAILAGIARRAFLKGAARSLGCGELSTPSPAQKPQL